MVSASQLRELVSEYLRGAVDLEEFSNRFAVMFDDIEDSDDADAIQLSYRIESHLADVSAGVATEAVLREALIPCLLVVSIEPDFRAPDETIQKSEATSPYNPANVQFA